MKKEKGPEKTKTYIVQAGSFLLETNANKLKNKLIKSGFDCLINRAGLNYIVQCGIFSVKENAETLKKNQSLLTERGYQ